jgi:hypothetical protein
MMRNLQGQLAILTAAWILAYLVSGKSVTPNFWAIWIGLSLLLECIVFLCLKALRRLQKRDLDRFRAISSVSLVEAKNRVVSGLASTAEARPARTTLPPDIEMRLPNSSRELFAIYESVALPGLRLATELIADSSCRSGFTRIGVGEDGTEIVVRAGDERVWEIEDGDPEEEFQSGGFPSIWHLLLPSFE